MEKISCIGSTINIGNMKASSSMLRDNILWRSYSICTIWNSIINIV